MSSNIKISQIKRYTFNAGGVFREVYQVITSDLSLKIRQRYNRRRRGIRTLRNNKLGHGVHCLKCRVI